MSLPPHTEILETLGEGSFGTVYVARVNEGALQRTVVLKVLKANWSNHPEILERSRDEATLLARLNHDNIVRVEQLTELDGRPAVVMEHVQGLTLDRILSENGPMPVGVAVAIAAKVARALDAAYNTAPPGDIEPLRVVHRDIKPSNIIVSVSGAVKVLDFGTAKADFGTREARTSALTIGSPLYMAPEAFDGATPEPTVDIYALGATLFEMVAGVPMGKLSVNPDKHKAKLDERIAQLRNAELKETDPALRALRNLIERCMRYDPDRRPKAADMKRLCGEFLRRLPRGHVSLDQFAEVTVEPLYQGRTRQAPGALGGTLSGSSLTRARNTGSSGAWANTPPPTPNPDAATQPPAPAQAAPPARGSRGVLVVAGVALVLALAGVAGFIVASQPAPPEPAVSTPDEGTTSRREERAEKRRKAAERQEALEAMRSPSEEPRGQPPAQVERLGDPPPSATPPAATAVASEPAPKSSPTVSPQASPTASADPTPQAPAGETVSVRLVSLPAGATVTVGGVTAKTPVSIQLPSGAASAQVSFPDGTSGTCAVRLTEGGQLAFRTEGGSVSCP
jgi:serine/threonine protein kinase